MEMNQLKKKNKRKKTTTREKTKQSACPRTTAAAPGSPTMEGSLLDSIIPQSQAQATVRVWAFLFSFWSERVWAQKPLDVLLAVFIGQTF